MALQSLFCFLCRPGRGYMLLFANALSDDPLRRVMRDDSLQCATGCRDCVAE